jgi:hypothetical protein
MRRLLTWLVVTIGIAALVRRLRRRRTEEAEWSAPETDPADELRQKLADSRAPGEQAAEQVPEQEPAPVKPPTAEATVDERRSEVHAQGRSTLEEMRDADET